jgi:hypothetical protein
MDELSHSIEELRFYYNSIAAIRSQLELVTSNLGIVNFENGFAGWPIPNGTHYRTPEFLFLKTMVYPDGREHPIRLFTSFGEVMIMEGGNFVDAMCISKVFMKTMNWDIIDVSDTIVGYHYTQKTNVRHGPSYFNKQLFNGSKVEVKIYFIARIGDITYPIDKHLAVFYLVIREESQYKLDNEQFKLVSGGRMCF